VAANFAAADGGEAAASVMDSSPAPPPPSHDLPTIQEDDTNGSQEKNKNKRENEKHGKHERPLFVLHMYFHEPMYRICLGTPPPTLISKMILLSSTKSQYNAHDPFLAFFLVFNFFFSYTVLSILLTSPLFLSLSHYLLFFFFLIYIYPPPKWNRPIFLPQGGKGKGHFIAHTTYM
jgi:hypothetical protein